MMIIYFLNKHNTFILIPHFDILKPLFLWIDHKAHLFSFLNYFKIVKYILIFINPHLLQNNLLLIFHQPIYPFIIDLNAIIGYDTYCLLNQGVSGLFCMWRSIGNHERRHYTITEILFEFLLDLILILCPFRFLGLYLL